MYFYNFKDYEALFDLIDYSRVQAGLFFKLIRYYNLKSIDELYVVCKAKRPKKEHVITSNIDSHIARAIDLLLYPKKELIFPVARFYGERLKAFLKANSFEVLFTKDLLRGEPLIYTIDLIVKYNSQEALKDKLKEFYLFDRFLNEEKGRLEFLSKRGHIFNLYVANPSNFGTLFFILSFKESLLEKLRSIFPGYAFALNGIEYGGKVHTFSKEEEVFEFLDMQFIPYELRWDGESIDKAVKKEIPQLVESKDIRGDFHNHTYFSDGEGYLEDLVEISGYLHYDYVGVTEHSRTQKTGNGINVIDWYMERDLIEKLNRDISPFRILSGLEVDILGDGGLDFPDDIIKQMDIVILALHHPEWGTLDPNEKIAYGMRSGLGSILAHPKDRYWGRKPFFELDLSYLFENAKRHNVALEISSIPDRIGFSAEELKEGKVSRVKFAINADAHAPGYLKNMDIGIIRARRGWLTKEDVINTYTLERLREEGFLKNG